MGHFERDLEEGLDYAFPWQGCCSLRYVGWLGAGLNSCSLWHLGRCLEERLACCCLWHFARWVLEGLDKAPRPRRFLLAFYEKKPRFVEE